MVRHHGFDSDRRHGRHSMDDDEVDVMAKWICDLDEDERIAIGSRGRKSGLDK
jgi:hypothetical protein